MTKPVQKVLLMILDGWGRGDGSRADVISTVRPPFLTNLEASWPHALLRTDGLHVGLPEGQMGNSEVGHLNIGAGPRRLPGPREDQQGLPRGHLGMRSRA